MAPWYGRIFYRILTVLLTELHPQFTTNNGYTFEVVAHWISSYFRNDTFLHIPPTPAETVALADRHTAWLRRRYPGMLGWINESACGDLAFWK